MTRLELVLLLLLVAGGGLIVVGVDRFDRGAALIVAGVLLVALVASFVRRGGLGGEA